MDAREMTWRRANHGEHSLIAGWPAGTLILERAREGGHSAGFDSGDRRDPVYGGSEGKPPKTRYNLALRLCNFAADPEHGIVALKACADVFALPAIAASATAPFRFFLSCQKGSKTGATQKWLQVRT
jgi:hypothetical protein